MTRDARQPPDVPPPRAAYSPVVVAGPLMFTAGQVAFGPDDTLVAGGAAALTSQAWFEHLPTPRPDLDPVGAGDAFNAGYLAARLSGASVEGALERGARSGAEVASTIGDTGSLGEAMRIERRSP